MGRLAGDSRQCADALAVVLVALLIIVALIGGSLIGLTMTPSLSLLMSISAGLLLIAACYFAFRPTETKLFQIALYIALWMAFPPFGVRLTYLGSALGFPLQDQVYAMADAALGLSWIEWADFITRNPWLNQMARLAYASSYWQPFVITVTLALFGRRDDNAKFLIAMLVALALTMIPHTIWPSVGPAPSNGFENRWNDVVMALRAGHPWELPYVGIITFPSFHATMATLFVLVCRNVPVAAVIASEGNLCMLASIPYPGGHYFVDVPAGVAIAVAGYWAAGYLCQASTTTFGHDQAPRQTL